jgi:hypothetical protein
MIAQPIDDVAFGDDAGNSATVDYGNRADALLAEPSDDVVHTCIGG